VSALRISDYHGRVEIQIKWESSRAESPAAAKALAGQAEGAEQEMGIVSEAMAAQ